MPKPWKESFDFYITRFDEAAASIFVDVAAEASAPLSTHPQRLFLRVKMKQAREDGLRSKDEADALFAFEDAMLRGLRPVDALFLGRVVARGHTDFFFYAPDVINEQAVVTALQQSPGEYETEFAIASDPDWRAYFEFLFPSPVEYQLILNRKLLETLAERGDAHVIPRRIDHLAFFSDLDAAQAATEALVKKGYAVDPPIPPEQGEVYWRLAFTRVDPVTPEASDAFSMEVWDVIASAKGEYDGWGCDVVKPN